MTAAEKRISAFCTRHRFGYEWQALRCNGRRAVVESLDRNHHAAVLKAARRLKGIRVTGWTNSDGGVWEGRIFLQDAADCEGLKGWRPPQNRPARPAAIRRPSPILFPRCPSSA